jgi:hypothetical protein
MYTIQITFDQEEGRDIFADVQADPSIGNYIEASLEATKALTTIIAEGMFKLGQEGTLNIFSRTLPGARAEIIYHVEVANGRIEVTE